jgi:hypothetical protein
LQRTFTRFPLTFGLQDMTRLNEPDEGYRESAVGTFEKIPNYDPHDRTVFPRPDRIKKNGLRLEIITSANSKNKNDQNVFPEEIVAGADDATVLITLPDTGVQVFYRFKRMKSCWFLTAISDRST